MLDVLDCLKARELLVDLGTVLLTAEELRSALEHVFGLTPPSDFFKQQRRPNV